MLQLRNNCFCAFSKPSCPAPARLSLFSKLFYKADIVHCSFLLTSQKKFFSNYPELLDGPEGIVVLPGNTVMVPLVQTAVVLKKIRLPLTLLVFQSPLPVPAPTIHPISPDHCSRKKTVFPLHCFQSPHQPIQLQSYNYLQF